MTREQAQKYREQAQRLLENASPEQRQQLENLARKLAQNNQNPQQPPQGHPDQLDSPNQNSKPDSDTSRSGGGDKDQKSPPQPNPGSSDGNQPPMPRPAGGPGSGGPRLANDPASRQPWEGGTDLVDARRNDRDAANEKTIAEWYNPSAPAGTGVDRSPAPPSQAFQHAAEGAERAIEQQAVPNQYADFVRRVFGRYVQRSTGQAPPPPPAIENAPDAKPVKKQ